MSCVRGCRDEALEQQTRNSLAIDQQLLMERKKYAATLRLLVLGTETSERRAIIKRMKFDFSKEERLAVVPEIKSNIKHIVETVLTEMSKICPAEELENKELEPLKARLLEELPKPTFVADDEFFDSVEKLWADPGVQRTFQRSNEYQLIDCAPYFMEQEKLKEIRTPEYLPSFQDILRCHHMTSGIYEAKISVNNIQFHIFEVEPKIERRKWIHCFNDHILAIIFVADCSSFNVIGEDGKTNRLRESLELFENCRWLGRVPTILLLNKVDILKNKLDQGENIEDYFPEFSSFTRPADDPQYIDEDAKEIGVFDKAKLFFVDLFLQLSKKLHDGCSTHHFYSHFTTAVDVDIFRVVFACCRDVILLEHVSKVIEKL